jgi:hypothetical protein
MCVAEAVGLDVRRALQQGVHRGAESPGAFAVDDTYIA